MVRRAPLARGKEWDAKLLVFLRLARAARVLSTVSSRQHEHCRMSKGRGKKRPDFYRQFRLTVGLFYSGTRGLEINFCCPVARQYNTKYRDLQRQS
jgi:hypothetical protein